MTIETKYNINDELWFIHPLSQKAVQGRVKEIVINIGGKPIHTYPTDGTRGLIKTGEYKEQIFVHLYTVDDNVRKEGCIKRDYELFKTKEELVVSIKQKADTL